MTGGILPTYGECTLAHPSPHPPPPLDPSLGQQARDQFVVVILPVAVVDPRRAAKLGAQHHQRLIQQPLGLEVSEHSAHRLVCIRTRCPGPPASGRVPLGVAVRQQSMLLQCEVLQNPSDILPAANSMYVIVFPQELIDKNTPSTGSAFVAR